MQKFNQQLEELIMTMRSLSEELEKNEVEFSDILSKDSPFNKVFRKLLSIWLSGRKVLIKKF